MIRRELETRVHTTLGSGDGGFRALGRMIDQANANTWGHSERVRQYAVTLARSVELGDDAVELIRRSALVHDLGKVLVPLEILDKPGPLTTEEFEILARHPVIGDEILSTDGRWDAEARIVRHHHERVDGKGYPDGLLGPDIPEESRILCVADCFDSMISNRAHRRPLEMDEALGQLRRGAGTQFDALFVATFVQLIGDRWTERATRLGASTLLAEISLRDHEEAVQFAARKFPRASLGGLASILQLDFPDLSLMQAQKVVVSVLAPDRLPDDLASDDVKRIKDNEVRVRYPARIDGDVSSMVLFERRLYCIVGIHGQADGRFEYHLKR